MIINKKCWLLILIILGFFIIPYKSANAYSFSGSDLFKDWQNDTITLDQAASTFSQYTEINFDEAKQVLQNLKNIDASAIIAGNVIDNVTQNLITPEIALVLSTIDGLGELNDLSSIEDIFKNTVVMNSLNEILAATGSATAVTDAITTITLLAATPEIIQDLGAEVVSNAIISVLQQLNPGLYNFINSFIDFDGYLTSYFGGGGGGSYEIFSPEYHASPVPKNCSLGCFFCVCRSPIQRNHIRIRRHVTNQFIRHRTWMIDEFFRGHILPAMAMMTSQLSTVAVQQTMMIGTFFDAKHQLETQRLFQQLMAEAHKDYQPSEGLCEIGTNVRSLAASEQKSKLAHQAFTKRAMNRQLRNADTIAGNGDTADIDNRIEAFKENHCSKNDNSKGLNFLCAKSTAPSDQVNKDVDFTRTIESKLTLNIDYTKNSTATPDTENVLALTSYLFAHDPLPVFSRETLATDDGTPKAMAYRYMDTRSIAAKRSVALNAFNAIAAERSEGDPEVATYLKSIIFEMGVPEDELDFLLGENPSYFAQMEVLTKNIYQNPTFYTELYDKPVNVLRKNAALKAIRLMQERDFYKSQIRSEAVLAIMLETMLQDEHERVEAALITLGEGE